MQPLFE